MPTKILLQIFDFDSVVKNTKSQNQVFEGGAFNDIVLPQL